MMHHLETVEGRALPGGSYSLAVADEHTVYLAGHFGKSADGELPERFEDEVALALDNFGATLARYGLSFADVAQVTCVLTDVASFAEFDRVYRTRFTAPFPARMTYGVALAGGLRFEIIGTAVRGGARKAATLA